MIYYLLELDLSDGGGNKNTKLLRLGHHNGSIYSFHEDIISKYQRKYNYLKIPPNFYTKEYDVLIFYPEWRTLDTTYCDLFNWRHYKEKFEYYKQGLWYYWSQSIIDDFKNTSFDDLAIQVIQDNRDILDMDKLGPILENLKYNHGKSLLISDYKMRRTIESQLFISNSIQGKLKKKYRTGKEEYKKNVKEFLGYYNNINGESNKLEFYCDFLELYPTAIEISEVPLKFKKWVSSLGLDIIKNVGYQVSGLEELYDKLPETERYILNNFKVGDCFSEDKFLNSGYKKFSHLRKIVRDTFPRQYIGIDEIQSILERYLYTKRYKDSFTHSLNIEIVGYKRC